MFSPPISELAAVTIGWRKLHGGQTVLRTCGGCWQSLPHPHPQPRTQVRMKLSLPTPNFTWEGGSEWKHSCSQGPSLSTVKLWPELGSERPGEPSSLFSGTGTSVSPLAEGFL